MKTPNLLLTLSTFAIALVCAALLVVSPPPADAQGAPHAAFASFL